MNQLTDYRRVSRRQIEGCLFNPLATVNSNCIIILTAQLDGAITIYGPRGYRYLLLEAGHIGQNLGLAASALGLGSLCVGGFDDVKLGGLIGIDFNSTITVYCVCIGARVA
jgi:SagB-type dehydrogenase family enzyme